MNFFKEHKSTLDPRAHKWGMAGQGSGQDVPTHCPALPAGKAGPGTEEGEFWAISHVSVAFTSPRSQGHLGALVTNGSGASTPHWPRPERDARGGLVGAQEVGPQTLPPPSVGSGR